MIIDMEKPVYNQDTGEEMVVLADYNSVYMKGEPVETYYSIGVVDDIDKRWDYWPDGDPLPSQYSSLPPPPITQVKPRRSKRDDNLFADFALF